MRVSIIGTWVLVVGCGGDARVLGAGVDDETPGPGGRSGAGGSPSVVAEGGAGGRSVIDAEAGAGGDPLPPCEERCFDGILNGDETDVDCGGAVCSQCDPEISCVPGDCAAPAVCACGLCLMPDEADRCPRSCANGIWDGPETDVDCGGEECAPCQRGQRCRSGSDCESGICPGQNASDRCAGPLTCG
jgi:hypothetical protein